jgi:hypothetical protein
VIEAALMQVQALEDRLPILESLAFLRIEVLGSTLLAWSVGLIVGIAAYLGLKLAVRIVAGRVDALARHTSSETARVAADLLRDVKEPVYLVLALWAASLPLTLGEVALERMGKLVMVVLLVQFALWCARLVNWGLGRYQERQLRLDPATATAIGAMSFNFRLLLAPVEILDYVVEHEVAHLELHDHSPRFWELLASRCPEWCEHERWLRRHGHALRL